MALRVATAVVRDHEFDKHSLMVQYTECSRPLFGTSAHRLGLPTPRVHFAINQNTSGIFLACAVEEARTSLPSHSKIEVMIVTETISRLSMSTSETVRTFADACCCLCRLLALQPPRYQCRLCPSKFDQEEYYVNHMRVRECSRVGFLRCACRVCKLNI